MPSQNQTQVAAELGIAGTALRALTANPAFPDPSSSDSFGNLTWDYTPASATVTISLASPGVVSWTAHGLPVGTPVVFSTTGALYTGLTAGTTYYVSATGYGADAFSVSTTLAGALAGTGNVATTGTQSGTQTCTAPGVVASGPIPTFLALWNAAKSNGWLITPEILPTMNIAAMAANPPGRYYAPWHSADPLGL